MDVTCKRPTGITITGWLWIATGGLMTLSAVMAGFAYSMMGPMGPPPTVPADMPSGFVVMTNIFQYFGLLIVLQLIVAALAVWSGIGLLRLQAWARTTIEVLSWLALAYCVGFGIFWVYIWIAMTGHMPPNSSAPVDANAFQWVGAAMGVVVTAVFAVPLWIMIRYLRGTEARAATQRPVQANA